MTTAAKRKTSFAPIETLLGQQGELFKRLLKESLQEVLEAEMTAVVGAAPGERTVDRSGYRGRPIQPQPDHAHRPARVAGAALLPLDVGDEAFVQQGLANPMLHNWNGIEVGRLQPTLP